MIDLIAKDFTKRVFTSRELVKFTYADPYNHMATGKYMEMAINLRTEAVNRQAGFDAVKFMSSPGIGFPIVSLEAIFLRPCKLGEYLELSTWSTEYQDDGFIAKVMFIGAEKKDFRAGLKLSMKSVTVKDGRLCTMPTIFPSSFTEDPTNKIPFLDDYIQDVRLVPKSFLI